MKRLHFLIFAVSKLYKPSSSSDETNIIKQKTLSSKKKKKEKTKKTTKRHTKHRDHPTSSQLDGLLIMTYGSFPGTTKDKIHKRIRKMSGAVMTRAQFVSAKDERLPNLVIMGAFTGGKSAVFDKLIECDVKTTNMAWFERIENKGQWQQPSYTTKWKEDYIKNHDANKRKRKRGDGEYDETVQEKPPQPVLYNSIEFCGIL